jgi:copper chaperone
MTKKLIIEGMSCQHCVKHVADALQELSGVKSVKVDLESKHALIELEAEVIDEEFIAALEEAGYELVKIE